MLWIREEFYKSSYCFGKKVIFGHTPTIYIRKSSQPVWNIDKLAIDTGCVYGGWLSAVEIVNGSISKIFQVKSDRARICECA